MIKKYLLLTSILFLAKVAVACPACEKQQPWYLRGLVHAAGPDSRWDYLIVAAMLVITCYVLSASLRCLFKPAERNQNHIKRRILNDVNL